MSEANNVVPLPPKHRLRPATIDDAAILSGVLSAGVGDSQFAELVAKKNYQAAVALLASNAWSIPQNREDLMYLLAGMWEHDVSVEEPHEDWDYDPDPKKVEEGQAISREERWRSISRKNRRRMVKRIELGKLPAKELQGFWNALKGSIDLKDFLDSLKPPSVDSSGGSSTESNAATGGETSG